MKSSDAAAPSAQRPLNLLTILTVTATVLCVVCFVLFLLIPTQSLAVDTVYQGF